MTSERAVESWIVGTQQGVVDYLSKPKVATTATGLICNHYGQMVNSEHPIAGVVQNNEIYYLGDEIQSGIDLQWEAHKRKCRKKDHDSCYDSDGEQEVLIGQWKRQGKKGWIPDITGEYAAIVGEIYTIVYWSRHTARHALCSPCYAGCGDIDTAGEFLTYTLPDDVMLEQTPELTPFQELKNAALGVLSYLEEQASAAEMMEHELDAHDESMCVLCSLKKAVRRAVEGK